MTTKKTTNKKAPATPQLLGPLAPADNIYIVWFDLGDDGRPDLPTMLAAPAACLVTYKYKGQIRVGAMALGPGGLYLAEIEDDNYQGYAKPRQGQSLDAAVDDFVTEWIDEVFPEEDEEEEDEEDEEEEDEEDEDDDEDEQ